MDVKISYAYNGDITKLVDQARPKVMAVVRDILTSIVDDYMLSLETHMGTIHGGSAYTDKAVRWAPLDEDSLAKESTFWYESSEAKNSLVMNFNVVGNRISAFAGIPSGSDAYSKALWNELGFSTSDGKFIRRPLFIPLAEIHLMELNKRLRETLQQLRIEIKVPV